jgi:hypothetical protein
MARMNDLQNPYIKGRTLEELIDALGTTSEPGTIVHEPMKAAVQAKMVERLAMPRQWAVVSLGSAVVSSVGAAVSAIATL